MDDLVCLKSILLHASVQVGQIDVSRYFTGDRFSIEINLQFRPIAI